MSDFLHLGGVADLARELVTEASRRREGINILLYGLPGTGKSEFARALADAAGLSAVLIGETDENGNEPDRSERLAHLAITRSLVRKSSQHLLVVDEAEDMIGQPGYASSRQSKLYLNSLIEQSTAPTIWIVNDPSLLGAPVVRRMAIALEFALPTSKVRERLVSRIASAHKLDLTPAELATLARIEAAPAVFDHALRVARWTDGSVETACSAVKSIQGALGVRVRDAEVHASTFDPHFCASEANIGRLVERLAAASSRSWSLLAAGPPGTGKSALARHIAQCAGLPIIEKRASDLLDMFVGNTEKGIARAFDEAAAAGAMLIIDEADSLLRDRSLAQRSWEVSMTNEMLTWMERSPTPFVATTNLGHNLDPATARRFLFKVELRPLDYDRAERLFLRLFGVSPPKQLRTLDTLTPGDFALVARKAAVLGVDDPRELVEFLANEAGAKPGAIRQPIGF